MFEERIDKGIRFLDSELGTEWPKWINLITFDIQSPCRCVLGQLFSGVNGRSGFYYMSGVLGDVTAEYGFDVTTEELRASGEFGDKTIARCSLWDTLSSEWRFAIEQLLENRFSDRPVNETFLEELTTLTPDGEVISNVREAD